MQSGDFLGNDRIRARLAAAFSRGTVSHCYLISGPGGSGKHTLARWMGAALQCTGPRPPCMVCPACRKALHGQHPDIITIDDPDRRTLPVDLIRRMSADTAIRPNEGRRKVYLIPRAQDMLPPAQNALLKIMEEPPAYCTFLLLSSNADALLPTVRSRCVELALSPLPEPLLRQSLQARFPEAQRSAIDAAVTASDGYLGRAQELLGSATLSEISARFLETFAARDALKLIELTTSLEKCKRNELNEELTRWQELLLPALKNPDAADPSLRRLSERYSQPELLSAIQTLRQAQTYLNANVSPAIVCGFLSVQLR